MNSEPMSYVCSPLSAPSRAEMLANAAKAMTYMVMAERKYGGRAVAPHAFLPYLLDDRIPEERELAMDFDMRLMRLCTQVVVFGQRITAGMEQEIEYAHRLGLPVYYSSAIPEQGSVQYDLQV